MRDAKTIGEAACRVLTAGDPDAKFAAARDAAKAWRAGALALEEIPASPPDRPARPPRPELKGPGDMPRRSAGGTSSRIAMLHAVAHIEFNAIDLAWDLVARFGAEVGERTFIDDWVRVGAEEAVHFSLIRQRLQDLGADYGDLPAHDGLWEAAQETADSLLARLAIVPLVLEARGLDVSPDMAAKFRKAGDEESARCLDVIYRDEVGHVAAGMRWFRAICAKSDHDPVELFQRLVRERFRGPLKPPFNEPARSEAGLLRAFYQDL